MDSIDLYGDFNDELDARARDDEENEQVDDENGEDRDVNKEVVDANIKKVRIKRKIPTLNAERLKGPRGIIAVDDFYKGIKFKGKGYEKNDLNEVMKRMEHWAHRMFPKYNFDDSLSAIERLGKKKELSVHMARYRLDQLTKDEDERVLSDDDDELNKKRVEYGTEENAPMDEFEALIDEQIALSTVHSRTHHDTHDKSFGNISSISSTTNPNDRIASSTQIQNQTQPSQPEPLSQAQIEISDEIKARVAENKRKALAIYEQRKKEAEEKKKQLELEEQLRSQEVSNIEIDDF